MTAYFSPAEEMSELCLTAPAKLSMTAASQTVRAGQSVAFDVALTAPEAVDVVVALQASDAAALAVPASVTIRAGQRHASFAAQASRPGSFEISASTNSERIAAPVRVTGLVISEVFYNPASNANHLQWVELANLADVPLNLAAYSIGAGSSDFMRTRMQLPMTIPAHGCIVVGGPSSSAANYYPIFAVSADLDPNLEVGTGQAAAGVGLFTTVGMSSMALPIDAIVYGGTNRMLRGPDGQLAPVWPGSSAGGSIKRMTDSVWARSTAPTPGVCEVLDAS